jgi:acetyltransferase-like isoleucine patch superfamily enzyme
MKHVAINALIRYPRSLACRLRILWLRLIGVRIGRNCWLRGVSVPRNPWDIEIADGVSLDDGVVLLTSGEHADRAKLTIGARTYVNRNTMFDVSDSIEVGEDCLIGPFCYITDHDHGRGLALAAQPLVSARVKIGRNVWLGAGVIVLKGVIIGDNVVVGAGSVVTKAVPSGTTIAGVPARPLLSGDAVAMCLPEKKLA